MSVIKNTTFLTCIVACGAVMFITVFHSLSTSAGSGLLSERQLAGIFGGRDDCEETDNVEGCGNDGNSVTNITPVAVDWLPNNDPEPCPDPWNLNWPGGPSASGEGAVEVEGLEGRAYCHRSWPYHRGDVVENAYAKLSGGLRKECVPRDDTTKHCVVCTMEEDDISYEYEQIYYCPSGE